MMETFHIGDALRCVLLNEPRGPNLACSPDALSGPAAFGKMTLWRDILRQRRHRVTLGWWEGFRLASLASVRAGAGLRVWEVDHLHLPASPEEAPSDGGYDQENPRCYELLEQLARTVGQQAGERIFLRLPADSPAVPLARRAGFFPYFEETVLEGQAGSPKAGGPPVSCRERWPQDDHALFQLFAAATPPQVRAALGLTFDQWQGARDLHPRWSREWVSPHNGRITGWLGLSSRSGVVQGQLLVHPDHPEVGPALMGLGLARGGFQRWLVADYQGSVTDRLGRCGFREVARYALLVKTVTARVLSRGMAPVEA